MEAQLTRIARQEWRRTELQKGGLGRALEAKSARVRARAALAVGRMGLIVPRKLIALLDDEQSRVRAQAAFALTLLVQERPGLRHRALDALRARLRAEKEATAREEIILAIGRLGEAADAARLEAVFSAPPQRTALRAWGLLARRLAFAIEHGAALGSFFAAKDPDLRRAAAWAAAQRRGEGKTDALWPKLLELASSDADETTRLWATRAVVRQGAQRVDIDWLLARLRDPSPWVREAATAAFARRGVRSAVKLTNELRRLWREAGANHHRLTGRSVFVVLAGVRALEKHARIATIRQFAADLLYLSDASDAAVRYGATEALSVDRVHCAAARLWDLGVERIERTPTCGTARAPDLSASWRRKLVVSTIVEMEGRDADWKLTLLRRYLRDEDPSVRAAALGSLTTIEHPAVGAALMHGLDDQEPEVLGSTLQVIAARKGQSFAPGLTHKVQTRIEALRPLAAPALVCDGLAALRRLGARSALPLFHRLQQSPAAAIRRCAAEAASGLHPNATRPQEAKIPSRGLPDLRWSGKDGVPLPREAVLVTRRGEVRLSLFGDLAPAAVARFAQLAVRQGFKGALFSSRRHGALVTGTLGQPRWQSEGITLPDEPHPMRPAAGLLYTWRPLVGGKMARDSAQKAFFITLEDEANLPPDATVFGRVQSGLDVLSRTHVGEKIKDLYIPQPKAPKGATAAQGR